MDELFSEKRAARLAVVQDLAAASSSSQGGTTESDEGRARLRSQELEFDGRQRELEAAVASDLEPKHAEEQYELRQRQLEEVHVAFRELAPEEVLRRYEAGQAERQRAEMAEFKAHMEQDKEER